MGLIILYYDLHIFGGKVFTETWSIGGSFWRTWNDLEWAFVVQGWFGHYVCCPPLLSPSKAYSDSRTDSQSRVLSMDDLVHCNRLNLRLTWSKKIKKISVPHPSVKKSLGNVVSRKCWWFMRTTDEIIWNWGRFWQFGTIGSHSNGPFQFTF